MFKGMKYLRKNDAIMLGFAIVLFAVFLSKLRRT